MVRWRAAACMLAISALLVGACASADDKPTAGSHARPSAAHSDANGGFSGAVATSPSPTPSGKASSKAPAGGQGGSASPGRPDQPGKPPTTTKAPAPSSGLRTVTGSASVALTFDDGPSPAYTPQILDLLRESGVKATFCVIGVNVAAYPKLIKQIVREGHSLCNHSWSHDLHLGDKAPDAIRADMERTNAAIRDAVPGAEIKYFRHPGGNFTDASNTVARSLGMTPLSWSVDPRDWAKPGTEAIIAKVEGSTHAGSIVLSHDGGGDRSETVAAYRVLVPYLKRRFTLVAL